MGHKWKNTVRSNILKETPLKMEFNYKSIVFILTFKLQSSSKKYSPFDAIHLSRHFSTAQNSFEMVNFDAF